MALHGRRSVGHLMILLSAVVLGSGCPSDGETNEPAGTGSSGSPASMGNDDGDSSGAIQTSGTTSSGTESGDNGSRTAEDSSEGGTVDSTGSVDDGASESSGTGSAECDSQPPDIGPISRACIGYAAQQLECGMNRWPPECIAFGEAECQATITFDAKMWGMQCVIAYEEFYACLSELPCRDLESGSGCEAALAMLRQSC